MTDEFGGAAQVIRAVLGAEHGWEMLIRLGRSLELTDGLRDLAAAAVSAGRARDQMAAADIADRSPAGMRLAVQQRKAVRSVADLFKAALDTQYASLDEMALAGIDPGQMLADPFGTLRSVIDLDAVIRLVGGQFANMAAMSADEALYLRTYMQESVREERVPLLLRALFVTAVSMVEPIVSRMVQLLLYRAEKDRFDSLGDPRLDREVRERCFGGPARWRQVLADLGVTMLYDAIDWDRLGELWEDRNVFAHRGGVTDERHSRKRGTTAGSALELELAAVQAAIDDVGAIRFGLVGATWVHLCREAGEVVANAAAAPAIEAIRAGRSAVAVRLARIQKAFAFKAEDQARAQVQVWLAIEACHGPDAILQDVTAWDVADLGAEFELARHVLMHEYGIVLDQLPGLIDAGVITLDQVRDWPLFDRMRAEGLLDPLFSNEHQSPESS